MKIVFIIFALCCSSNVLIAQANLLSKSDIIQLDFSALANNKKQLENKDAAKEIAYKSLIEKANSLLHFQPVSVMDKAAIAPSGNKHDYMSLAPYWWPDPSKPNGLPYIRKDGEVNPEVAKYTDKVNLQKLCENVYNLALAYYFSNDDKYAAHASKLLQAWFLDESTKMNPNLNYGQAVKGVIEGRAEGLIDTRNLIFVIEAVQLIKNSKHWTFKNNADLQNWFAQFLVWMQSSKIGQDELNAKNNHGVWYDAQALCIAKYIGNTDMANTILLRAIGRLGTQMDENGFFPLELERTTSLHYSVFILNAFYIIANLSENMHENLWALQTASGKSLLKAFNAIHPYITQQKKWDGKQILEFDFNDAIPILLRSAAKYNCTDCKDAIKNILSKDYKTALVNLL